MAMMFPKLPEEYEAEQKAAQRVGLPSTEARVLKGHEGAVLAVRFNPAGTYCLTCGKASAYRYNFD